MTTIEVAWAAGFFEGEGSFGLHGRGVFIGQVQRWPLERVVASFGGRIGGPYLGARPRQPIYRWYAHGATARAFVLAIFDQLSPRRREQAELFLAASSRRRDEPHPADCPHCLAARGPKATACPRGHPYDARNTYVRNGQHCRTCHRDKERARRSGEVHA